MGKKGISPLIATVLIIGFTVALAAIIITWSTGFTKRMQEQTEETANVQVLCATDVIFEITNVCKSDTGYDVRIENNGKEPIKSWKLRVYKDQNNVKALDKATPVESFGLATVSITTGTTGDIDFSEIREIEAFPVIVKGGKDIICAQNINSFGDASGNVIDNACTS